ncbi:hypothetical protein BC629DRAFT_801429 [Irpex lacteus]|nr:hypothetical protein BC629DRAFT_801429 [Irpex lacteus]
MPETQCLPMTRHHRIRCYPTSSQFSPFMTLRRCWLEGAPTVLASSVASLSCTDPRYPFVSKSADLLLIHHERFRGIRIPRRLFHFRVHKHSSVIAQGAPMHPCTRLTLRGNSKPPRKFALTRLLTIAVPAHNQIQSGRCGTYLLLNGRFADGVSFFIYQNRPLKHQPIATTAICSCRLRRCGRIETVRYPANLKPVL